jgi:hypothetical protein
MADRKHVVGRQLTVAATLLSMLLMVGCNAAPPPPVQAESRGRVIDEETGQGIAGALVVGRYMGSIAWAGASCDRIESATADQDGWFTIPNDSDGKSPFLEAYHRGYQRGYNLRYAVGLSAEPPQWQVWQGRRDKNAVVVSVVKEPTIYRSEREAQEASRQWRDISLRPFKGTREERLMSLPVGVGICGGGPQTTSGPIEFLEAILQEKIELGASESELRHTRSVIESALQAKAAAKARDSAKSK